MRWVKWSGIAGLLLLAVVQVYRHFVKTRDKAPNTTTNSVGTYSQAPMQSGSRGVLVGRIRDLSQSTADGWKRREIIIQQGSDGYPR